MPGLSAKPGVPAGPTEVGVVQAAGHRDSCHYCFEVLSWVCFTY
jgi:hypothetical protein